MALMPKRVKHRKEHRCRVKGNATRGNTVAFGDVGLQAITGGWMSARQIEAGRIAITHTLAREGKVYIRVFPNKPVSAKPLETRMGKGKGEPDYWAAVVRPGRVLFEVSGVPQEMAKIALNRCAHKLPLKVKLIARRQVV